MTTFVISLNLVVCLLATLVYSIPPPVPRLVTKKSPRGILPIAANASTFEELVQNSDVFLDKTLIIEQALTYRDKILLLSLPSAWGKTITLDMLKTFLELQLHKNGDKILPHSSTKNYKLFAKGEIILPDNTTDHLDSPLNIAKNPSILKTYQGQYPVIEINFSGINGSNYQQMIDGIRTKISQVFKRYGYITNSSPKTDQRNSTKQNKDQRKPGSPDMALFHNILNHKATPLELTKSLAYLSELLFIRFNQSVFILLDDWDSMFCSIVLSLPIPGNELNQTISFFTDLMLNTFTNNKYLEKGIITGTFRGLKLVPGFTNKVREFFGTSSMFYRLCGISGDEVDVLFDHLNVTKDIRARVNGWYSGYPWRPEIPIFNPRSIAHFANTKQILNYRLLYNHSSSNTITRIIEHDDYRKILESFIHLGWGFLKYKHMENKYLYRPFVFGTEKAFRTYLYDSGYFRIDDRLRMGIFRRIANHEVRNELCSLIMNYYKHHYKIPSTSLQNATVNFADFVTGDDTTSASLADDLKSLVSISRPDLLHFFVHFLSSQITLKHEYRHVELEYMFVAQRRIPAADLADAILHTKERAIIIKVLLDGNSTTDALECATNLSKHLKKVKTIESIKYIGIDVTSTNEVKIRARTQKVQPDVRPTTVS